MLIAQLFVKMPHLQIVITVAVQSQHLLHPGQRHSLRHGLPRRRSNSPS